MQRSDIYTSLRLAGDVTRYHTWPMQTNQSVAHHTWNVLRIWVELFGPPSPEVSVAILFHDCGEIVTGDLPFPVKSDNLDLKTAANRVESEALNTSIPLYHEMVDGLTEEQKKHIKICDLCEMLEQGYHERHLGNRYGELIVDNVSLYLFPLVRQLSNDHATKTFDWIRNRQVFWRIENEH